MAMQTSKAGRRFITTEEGRRLRVYKDTNGLWTIGVGHLLPQPKTLAEAQEYRQLAWTAEQADTYLASDLRVAEAEVALLVTPMSQPTFDALVSLTFNIGVGAFRTSTVAREIKRGDWARASEAILLWRSGGVLLERRKRERVLFDYGCEVY
jgi:lysozyme